MQYRYQDTLSLVNLGYSSGVVNGSFEYINDLVNNTAFPGQRYGIE